MVGKLTILSASSKQGFLDQLWHYNPFPCGDISINDAAHETAGECDISLVVETHAAACEHMLDGGGEGTLKTRRSVPQWRTCEVDVLQSTWCKWYVVRGTQIYYACRLLYKN